MTAWLNAQSPKQRSRNRKTVLREPAHGDFAWALKVSSWDRNPDILNHARQHIPRPDFHEIGFFAIQKELNALSP